MALNPPIDEPADVVRAWLDPICNDFSVALYSCQNPFAVGAIIRVAHSFLAKEILIIGDEPYYAKASMGMEKFEHIERCPSEEDFFERVRGRPVWAVEKEYAKQNVVEVASFPPNVVFLLGSERFGLPKSAIDRADHAVAIPMYGINNSFPVTVAAGIVMHEWARRRYAPPALL
jgi:tRNA G18 (ribose-2'-O)-methylase SpoU